MSSAASTAGSSAGASKKTSWLDKKRLNLLLRHMRLSSLRIVQDQTAREDRGVYPLSELTQRNYQNVSMLQISREIVLAIDILHESGVSLNGQMSLESTFIREMKTSRFKIQFNVPADADWSQYEARYTSLEQAQDIGAVGAMITQLLQMPQVNLSSKDRGERHWMMRLAEWMSYDVPHLRPDSSWCRQHHAMWKSHDRSAFIQAFNKFALSNRLTLTTLLPVGHLPRLFVMRNNNIPADWKVNMAENMPDIAAMLGGPRGLDRWRGNTLKGFNLSHFFQAMRDWEVHSNQIDERLQAALDQELADQSPIDFLLGRYPETLEYIIFRLVVSENYSRNNVFRTLIGFYSEARTIYISPEQRARHE